MGSLSQKNEKKIALGPVFSRPDGDRVNLLFLRRIVTLSPRIRIAVGYREKKMSKSKNFTGWAVDRAESIVSNQGLDLLHSTDTEGSRSSDQCVVRLTVAILEALIDARNFDKPEDDRPSIN